MNIEHSYSAEDELVQERFMPKLEAENDELLDSTQDQDHQQANETIGTVTQSTAAAPELEQQASIPTTTNVTVPTTSINKRKMPLVTAEVDLFDDLEDDDLRFKGYCYTSTGADGSMSFNDSFGCPHCPAIFDSRVGLTNHSKLHGATKKMKCQLCDFSCTNKKTMRLHRRIHGIIPVRGRRANPDSKSAQKAAAAKRIKVEDLDDDGDETEEGEEEAAADHQANNRRKRAHPAEDDGQTSQQGPNTRRRSKTYNQDQGQGPGAVDAGDVDVDVVAMHNPEEEPFVIITPNKRQRRQNNKKLSSRGGLEEEMVTSDGEEFSPKTRQQQAKERSQQSQNLSQRRGRKIVVQSDSSERPAGPGVSAPFHRHPGTSHHYSCSNCPYRTPQLYSLEQHMLGHSRPSGYVCSVCDYKHEYMRWLQTHCALHGNQAQWPPEYVYGNGEEADMKQEKEEEEANIAKQMGEKKPKTSTKKITPNARGMCQRFGTGGGRAGPSSSSTPIGY